MSDMPDWKGKSLTWGVLQVVALQEQEAAATNPRFAFKGSKVGLDEKRWLVNEQQYMHARSPCRLSTCDRDTQTQNRQTDTTTTTTR